MKKTLKKIIQPFYKQYHFWYHKTPRKFYYKNVYTLIQPTVFSPKHTVSTNVFLNYISTIDLKGKRVLELGCGSGIISIYTASKGALVTASDINKVALDSLNSVSYKQDFDINCIYSDLFNSIPKISFDYIIINPPYYPKKAKNIEEQAWFCGKDFEYFEKLFKILPYQLKPNTNCLMILSDDCEITTIKNIAKKSDLSFTKIHEKQSFFEKNYVYKIEINSPN